MKHQFAFPTRRIPDPITELPKDIEILMSIEIADFPSTFSLTLVHGWLIEDGEHAFTFAIYEPDGILMNLGDRPVIRRTFSDPTKLWYIAYHNVEITPSKEGLHEIEAICDGEVAVRYPLYIWQHGRSG